MTIRNSANSGRRIVSAGDIALACGLKPWTVSWLLAAVLQ